MTTTRTRFRGERGIAIITTALCLIPLMTFAAFGVDLASWYSRTSYLQKSADAAALAGTVWMPNLSKSRQIACDTLEKNGIDGGVCGTGDFEVTIVQGSTPTSLLVTVTDPSARRYFSQVLGGGDQRLTRTAEAEYNLPIPLGSPLNYFGGDADRTANLTHQEVRDVVVWPTDYNQVVHAPVNAPCNIGTSAGQALGRWTSSTVFNASAFSGSTRCLFEPRQGTNSGTITVAPPDYDRTTNLPTNVPCNAFATGTNGRWESATVWNAGARYTSGTGNRQCTWRNWTTSSVPSTTYRALATSINGSVRPCNLAYQDVTGRWPASGSYSSGNRFTGLHTAGNQFCQYYAEIVATTFVVSDPNPIDSTRSPGFWALIEGPGTAATQGDAYTPRCYLTANCGSVENASYRDTTNPDRGYWFVVKVPTGLSGSIDLQVFDASNNPAGSQTTLAGDSSINASNQAFETEYSVYRQTNPLDFASRTQIGSPTGNTAPGSCHWSLGSEATFRAAWTSLCTLSGVSAGDIYLINVRTNGLTGSGINGYALQACANGSCTSGTQPALYAYADMAMYNNIASGQATFYLAEVGPQYAGRTLVLELWDAGDATADATIYPMRPSAALPRPVVDVPAGECSYTSSPDPNAAQTTSVGGATGFIYATQRPSDTATVCGIRSTIGTARQFNGEWLRIRLDIPEAYTCTLGINPETTAGSCWWGIRYNFAGATTDVTTWQARVEGNPVHLTE
jgi:Putative Flp pilus-assembly TadE/G-like